MASGHLHVRQHEKMISRRSLYVGANALGFLLFVYFVRAIQNTMQGEERGYPDFGDSLTFIFTALPLVSVFAMVNLVWAVSAAVAYLKRRQTAPVVVCAIVVTCWLAAAIVVRGIA